MDPDYEPMDEQEANDPVNRPAHYQARCWVTLDGGERVRANVECLDVLDGLGFACSAYVWSAFQYLWRHGQKNRLEDLRKAVFYLNRLIAKCDGHERGNDE